jgi:hypothetical protein
MCLKKDGANQKHDTDTFDLDQQCLEQCLMGVIVISTPSAASSKKPEGRVMLGMGRSERYS